MSSIVIAFMTVIASPLDAGNDKEPLKYSVEKGRIVVSQGATTCVADRVEFDPKSNCLTLFGTKDSPAIISQKRTNGSQKTFKAHQMKIELGMDKNQPQPIPIVPSDR